MKRVVVIAMVAAVLWSGGARADTVGSRRMEAANRHCAGLGRFYARHGYSAWELRHLAMVPCKREPDGAWDSALVWTQ